MGVRRVPFKDWVWETAGAAPSRWSVVAGAWTVQSNTVECDDDAGLAAGTACAPAEQTTQVGTIPQAGEMYFDVKMNMVSKLALSTPNAMFIVFADAAVGAYLHNSYALEITEAATSFYVITNNAAAQLTTVANAHSLNTVYTFIIHRSAAGEWTITEEGVLEDDLTVTDTTYITGSYLGLYTNDAKTQWSEMRARYALCDWTYLRTRNIMTKEVSTAEFGFVPTDSTDESENWTVGDGVEVLLYDGTNTFVEFYGKVERIDDDDIGETRVTAYDWRVELLKAEGVYSGNSVISTAIKAIIASVGRVLTTVGVETTTEGALARTLNGEYAYAAIKKLAQEAGYFIIYGGSGLLSITNDLSASGITIVDDDIARFRKVVDLVSNVNTVKTYYSGGNNTTGGSGTDYNTYGRSERLIIDTAIPDATQATARASYFTNRYVGSYKVIDIWDINSAHAQLKPGDTLSLTCGWLGISALQDVVGLIIEKEFDSESGDGIRFRMTVESAAVERHGLDPRDIYTKTSENSLYGLGMQV